MKKRLPATDYLLKVLTWKSWVKHHTLLAIAIQDVLTELNFLRGKVEQYERK